MCGVLNSLCPITVIHMPSVDYTKSTHFSFGVRGKETGKSPIFLNCVRFFDLFHGFVIILPD